MAVLCMNKVCDFCKRDLTHDKTVYDAATFPFYQCALMCENCWNEHGIGELGLGKGQKYTLKSNGDHVC